MYRGTTPTVKIEIDGLDPIIIGQASLRIKQGTRVIELTDYTLNDDILSYSLSAEQTQSFKPGSILLQLILTTTNGKVMASDIQELPVDEVLNGGDE